MRKTPMMFETSKVTATTVAVIVSLAGTTTQLRAQVSCEWTLEETLRIGSIAGEDALSAVLDLEVGPEGDIYIAQQFLPHVTVFTPDGRPSRTIGRAGSGPGEFDGQPIYLGWMRDALWATDLAATHFFAPDGRPVRQVEFRVHVPEESSVFMPRRPLADGTFLARRNATTAGGGNMADFFEAERISVPRLSPSGDVVDTVAVPRHRMSVGIDLGDRGIGYTGHPLSGSWRGFARFTPSRDGSSVLMIGEIRDGERPASFDLLRVGLAGDTLMERGIRYTPEPVTEEDRAWLTEAFAANQAGDYQADSPTSPFPQRSEAERERDRRAAREAITFPDHHPPVRRIVAGDDGSIWLLRELDLPDRVDRWDVYDEGGAFEGTVLVEEGRGDSHPWAPRLSVLRATREEVWGTTLGELDEPYVHRYAVDTTCR